MYIIFLDESGQPGGFDTEQNKLVKNTSRFFILSGFMIDANKILNVEEKMKDIKLKYGLNPYYSAGIQVADFCAGAIFRKYEKEDEEFFDILKPSIRTHKRIIDGAGIKLYK